MAKLRHLHGVAILVTAMLACVTATLAGLQLIVPGVFHDAPALGYGRLLLAQYFIVVGVVANALVGFLYDTSPRTAAYAERHPVGRWLFAIVNFVVIAPLTFMALAGILPQSGPFAFLGLLQAPSVWASSTMVMLILQSHASMRTFVGGARLVRPGIYLTVVVGAMLALIAGHRGEDLRGRLPAVGASLVDGLGTLQLYWQIASLGSAIVALVCLVLLHQTAGRDDESQANTPPLKSRWDRIFAVIAVVVLVLWPLAIASDARSNAPAPATTASEAHGREIFIREGCSTCHNSEKRGVGPDLSRESGVRPADWHYVHLFLPALVSPRSPMPSYAHLFDGAPDKPTQEGRDLVAYIDSFGRDKDLAEPAEKAASAHPARARRSTELPLPSSAASVAPAASVASVAAGQRLFGMYCINCHGPKGEGNGTAASLLRPRPANLAAHRYASDHVTRMLWNGVPGTAMPAWRDLPSNDIASLSAYVSTLNVASDSAPPNADLIAAGAVVFAKHCSQCHGNEGAGDGFSAAQLSVPPANFQQQQPSLDYALRAIAGGVEGTPMAPWTSRLSEQDMLAVAHYVRSVYKGGSR